MTGFVCQCYLKERRRTPTGGLSEAGGVIGGGGGGGGGEGFYALVPWSGSKDLGASATRFPPTWEKRWILLGME